MTDSDSWDDEPTISVTEHAALDALNKERVVILKSRTANGDWCTTRSLTDFFKHIRDATVDRMVIETNTIIIRLSKLTSDDAPEEGNKKRVFERSIVPWAEDSTVRVCSTCGKGFNITRRRHHCRLCGGIMCDRCSEFMPYSQAKLLSAGATGMELHVKPAFLKRRGSNSSLSSLGSQETGPTLRVCEKCRKLLEKHRSRQEQKYSKPDLLSLYESIENNIKKAEEITPDYIKMAESLGSGETTYSMEAAAQLRQKISIFYSQLEATSKRIMNLNAGEEEGISDTALRLQLNIRAFILGYIQDNTGRLPPLPDAKSLADLVGKREEERKQKIENERRLAQQAAMRQPAVVQKSVRRPLAPQKPAVTEGWKPGEVDTHSVSDDDPMIQQMNIIKGYLKQAKLAQKHDEVEMLEDNLRYLEAEFYKVHNQCQ